jgi:hypothetical protein
MKKILIGISNYGTTQDYCLVQLIKEFEKYVEYDVDVIVYHTDPLDIDTTLSVEYRKYPLSITDNLTQEHLRDFKERRYAYDLYLYTENDHLITEDHLREFERHYEILPSTHIMGFLQYERMPPTKMLVGLSAIKRGPVIENVMGLNGGMYVRVANDHQGCYLVTSRQLNKMIDSGHYVETNNKVGIKPYAACIPYKYFTKVIPMDYIESLIWHIPDKYIKIYGTAISGNRLYTTENFNEELKKYV